ncbi:hypothetical protein GUITHDRAFT_105091 [Guillardia theta CCMP2712]|uniref:Uncharacterized protein n=1 Tax=Guillardia theta (strain CCMP2712) TaxID=905079 RepID=L1JKF2_GUITC|nr:hypothetical protein GUITHDRAFT_105091 [Guillardia theta CCMP2712]EKX49008.1 hypothetical protein GUITHDRAFT_105091 [Guillardia theta CCMP2712]|eukprot:XP_005835988.1 hypothetical protein GUITHDRAFT_105091 [Guillardia theta CCMP2712]
MQGASASVTPFMEPQRRPLERMKENLMHLPVPLMPDNKLVSSDSPSLSAIGRKFNYDMSTVMGEQKDRRMRLKKATAVENSYHASTPEKFQGSETVDDSQENASLLSELPELELCDVSPFTRPAAVEEQGVQDRPKSSPIVVSSQPLARANAEQSYGQFRMHSKRAEHDEEEEGDVKIACKLLVEQFDVLEGLREDGEGEQAPAPFLALGAHNETLEEKLRNLDQAFQTPFAARKIRMQEDGEGVDGREEGGQVLGEDEKDGQSFTADSPDLERERRVRARDSVLSEINRCCDEIAKINSSVKEMRLEIEDIRNMYKEVSQRQEKISEFRVPAPAAKPSPRGSTLTPLEETCRNIVDALSSLSGPPPRVHPIRDLADVDPKVLYLVRCRAYMRWRKKAMSELQQEHVNSREMIEV